jgi:hypothetical protein
VHLFGLRMGDGTPAAEADLAAYRDSQVTLSTDAAPGAVSAALENLLRKEKAS